MSYTQMPAATARLCGPELLTSGRMVGKAYNRDAPDLHQYLSPMIVSTKSKVWYFKMFTLVA